MGPGREATRSVEQAVGLKTSANRLAQTPCAGFLLRCYSCPGRRCKAIGPVQVGHAIQSHDPVAAQPDGVAAVAGEGAASRPDVPAPETLNMPPPIPRWNPWSMSRREGFPLLPPGTAAFPVEQPGRLPHRVVSGVARRSLALRPACSPNRQSGPFSRRLRRLCHLLRRSDSYRRERQIIRAGIAPAEDPSLFHGALLLTGLPLQDVSVGPTDRQSRGQQRSHPRRSATNRMAVDNGFV